MKKLIILTALFSLSLYIFPCTAFLLKTETELVFGKNYDFSIGYGIVFVNKRGVEKTAFTSSSPAKWISKYGSVTFNQYGREFPSDGMNEAGLVVELMWLDETVFPEPDERPSIGGILQWIQYQLDVSSTVEEVISSDKVIRIAKNNVPVHFLVADKSGNSVTIEYLNGKLVEHTGEKMPVKVLTNNTYESSVDYLRRFDGFGGNEKINNDKSSLNRFVKTCSMIKEYSSSNSKNAVEYGFDILKSNDQGDFTKWSIIYDINNLVVYFRTDKYAQIKNIELKTLDFKCSSPVKMIDLNNEHTGNINTSMVDYSYEKNKKIINDSFSNVDFLKDTPAESLEKRAKYPELFNCSEKSELNPEYKNKKTAPGLPLGIAVVFLIVSLVILLKFKNKRKLK